MTQPTFEVSAELRLLAEKSVEEARKGFEGFMAAAQSTRSNFEGAANRLRASSNDAASRVASFTEDNIRAAFDHAEKLVRAKNAEEAFALQLEFARSQIAMFQERMKELYTAVQVSVKNK
jgi:phasin